MIKLNVKSMAVYCPSATRLCDLNWLFKLNTSLVSQKVPIHVLSSLMKIVPNIFDWNCIERFWDVSSQPSVAIIAISSRVSLCLWPAMFNCTVILGDKQESMSTVVDEAFKYRLLILKVRTSRNFFPDILQFHCPVVATSFSEHLNQSFWNPLIMTTN